MSLQKKDLLNYLLIAINKQASSIKSQNTLTSLPSFTSINDFLFINSPTANIGQTVTLNRDIDGVITFDTIASGYISALTTLPINVSSVTLGVFIDISSLVANITKLFKKVANHSPTLLGFTSENVYSVSSSPLQENGIVKKYLIANLANYQIFINGLIGSSYVNADILTLNTALINFLSNLNSHINSSLSQVLQLNCSSSNLQKIMLSSNQTL
jgi:hypothetical protein